MKEISVRDIADVLKATGVVPDGIAKGVCTDSREVKAGDCFFALTGENFDGHDFVSQAIDKGAVCAVVSKSCGTGRELVVEDTTTALGKLAGWYRRNSGFKLVAVTGSAGKTTTRHIISHVLKSRYRVHESPKNFNNHIGLPLTILSARADTEIVIAEIGANHPGEISTLTEIAAPDIAVVTNAGAAHLEGFGTVEVVAAEKLSISRGLGDKGMLVVSADCVNLSAACDFDSARTVTFGLSAGADICADDVSYNHLNTTFELNGVTVDLPLASSANLQNALAAFGVCEKFGITASEFADAVKSLSCVKMRGEVLNFGSLTVINDCYNANPASMRTALEMGSNFSRRTKKRFVFISGHMGELGDSAEKYHRELGSSCAPYGVKMLICIGPWAEMTANAAEINGGIETKIFKDTVSACNRLEKYIKKSDIVLVKGSRVASLELVVDKLAGLYGTESDKTN
jgi:UDP-N-acetylmuramoyl-tripeptide--D-alanyl-D-alanine ligase